MDSQFSSYGGVYTHCHPCSAHLKGIVFLTCRYSWLSRLGQGCVASEVSDSSVCCWDSEIQHFFVGWEGLESLRSVVVVVFSSFFHLTIKPPGDIVPSLRNGTLPNRLPAIS